MLLLVMELQHHKHPPIDHPVVSVAAFKCRALPQMSPTQSMRRKGRRLHPISMLFSLETPTLATGFHFPQTHLRCLINARTDWCSPSSSTTVFRIPLTSVS